MTRDEIEEVTRGDAANMFSFRCQYSQAIARKEAKQDCVHWNRSWYTTRGSVPVDHAVGVLQASRIMCMRGTHNGSCTQPLTSMQVPHTNTNTNIPLHGGKP